MKFKYFIHRILTLRNDLKAIFIIALSIVILTDLWLIKIPEFFPLGSELGSLLYKLSIAYITGLIFYFINIHVQAQKKKVNTYNYLKHKTYKMEELSYTLLLSMSKACYTEPESKFADLNDESIRFISENFNPQYPFVLDGNYGITFPSWFAAVEFITKENKSFTDDLMIISDTLDSDVLISLLSIDSWLESAVNTTRGRVAPNKHAGVWAMPLSQYYKMTKKLNQLVQRKYKNHAIEFGEQYSFDKLTKLD